MSPRMTVATVSDWLDRLEGVRKAGNGYKARCPAHDDRNPSLSVAEGDGGKVLVTCFAGCTFEAIRDALVAPGRRHRHQGARSAAQQPAADSHCRSSAGAPQAARRPTRHGIPLPLR